MLRQMLSGKIHRATVTGKSLDYDGSITVDRDLMDAAGMLPGERVQVLNLMNGVRLETYLIAGRRGGATVCLNGPAARCGEVGDRVVICSYVLCEEEEARRLKPKIVITDERNVIVQKRKRKR